LSLISIIIPYYNKQSTIERCVLSVLNQSYQKWELYIIDDKSDQPLENNLNNQDSRIKVITNFENLGPGPTRQKGLEIAKGEYIAFLDADDWWHEDFLKEMLIPLVRKNKKYAGTWCITETKFTDGTTLRRHSRLNHNKIRETILKYPRPWQTGGILWRREYCGKWGNLSTSQDYYFELSTSLNCNFLLKVPLVLYYVDQTQGNHRGDLIQSEKIIENTYLLFSYFYNNCKSKISTKYKIILFHRILRALMKIEESNKFGESKKDVYWKDFEQKYLIPAMIIRRRFYILKLIHSIFQRSPFKLYF
jgi:glycosyltransferase involved in cell wall biosynthesis